MKTFAIYGPPGCGKTTEMLRRVEEAKTRFNARDIAFLSFTKAGAAEALKRLGISKSDKICTIHSLMYRLGELSGASIVDNYKLKKFGEKTGFRFRGAANDTGEQMEIGDQYISVYSKAVNRMRGLREEYHESERPGDWSGFEFFCRSYENWKLANGYLDFNDMIMKYVDNPVSHGARVIFVDEAQDLSNLQWAAIERMMTFDYVEEVHIAGDDDQCQPPGTMVSTKAGAKSIENLVDGDAVWSYSSKSGCFSERKVKIASRPYSGNLIVARIGDKVSKYTPNHKCMIRYKHNPEKYVVYLMRKGENFRIGSTKAFKFNKNGVSLYATYRAQQEGADDFWILKSFDSKEDAYVHEQYFSFKYGVPQAVFNYNGLGLKCDTVDRLWRLFTELPLRNRAEVLLNDSSKNIEFPNIRHPGGTQHHTCYAANLDPELHQMAVYEDGVLKWCDFEVSDEAYNGLVYSLDVDKTGTYIADGIYTHNSIFEWSGANTHGMVEFERKHDAERLILSQSWRVPILVHEKAMQLVHTIQNRVDKVYKPRDVQGVLRRMSHFNHKMLKHGDDVMILCRNFVSRKDIEEELIRYRVPYTNEGGLPGLFSSRIAQAIRVFRKLEAGNAVTQAELDRIMTVADDRTKGEIETHDFMPMLRRGFLRSLIIPPQLVDFYRDADLTQEPTIRLSTIHASKGREADHVILHTGLTPKTWLDMDRNPDAEARVFYVGLTRSKHTLDILEGEMSYGI
jgi:superfamily I DNA/RNA helicase